MEWTSILNTAVSGIVGAIAAILIARYSKTKQERDISVAREYLELVGVTADQLDAKRALIGKLDEDNRKLQDEVHSLKKKQAERDAQLLIMEARIAALTAQVDRDALERADLNNKLARYEVKNRVLWKYVIALLEQMKQHNIIPVDPPDGMTDPEILRLVKGMKDSRDEDNQAKSPDVS
jgi:uncharacterized protein (DUF342 family)